jgi:hypothetical protein
MFHLVAQCEAAYLKDEKGDIVRKYFAPTGQFFIPGVWEFDEFPKDYYLKTWDAEELRAFLNRNNEESSPY